MKKPVEIVVFVIIAGCLCSALIGELLVNGKWDFQHIFEKGSFYAILVFILVTFAYYGMKLYITKIKQEIIDDTCEQVKSQMKNSLKTEIKRELDNEIKPLITREVRNKYHNLKSSLVVSIKEEIQLPLSQEIIKTLKIDLIENSQWIEYLIYKTSQKNNNSSELVELSSLHSRLEDKFDEFFDYVKPKTKEGAGK